MKRFTIPRTAHCSSGCLFQSRVRRETARSPNRQPFTQSIEARPKARRQDLKFNIRNQFDSHTLVHQR